MRPIKLEIEGVKSFSEKAVIDFDNLLSDGIFGIFGDTGSGKSTILNSIILALYGKIPNEGKNKGEYVNFRSDKARVMFTFGIAVNSVRRNFTIERIFSLAKDRSYRDAKAKLMENKEDGSYIIADQPSKVDSLITEEIIGLGMDEFDKCIALPQGQFAEFVTAKRSDRMALIGKLFDLDIYGDAIARNVSGKLTEANLTLSEYNGKLSNYTEATSDAVKAAENECVILASEISETDKIIRENKDIIDKYKTIYEKSIQLENDVIQLKNLEDKKPANDKLKEELGMLETAKNILRYGDNLRKSSLRLSVLNKESEKIDILLPEAEKEALNAKLSYNESLKLGEKINGLTAKKAKTEEMLEVEKEINELEKERRELLKNYSKYNSDKIENDLKIQKLTINIEQITNAVKSLEGVRLLDGIFENIKKSALSEEYKNEIGFYEKELNNLNSFTGESKLYGYVNSLFDNRKNEFIELLKECGSGDIDEKSIVGQIETVKNDLEKKDKLSKQLSEYEGERLKCEGDKKLLQANIDSVIENGRKLKEQADAKKKRITDVVGIGETITGTIANLNAEITALNKKIAAAKERYDKSNDNYNALKISSTENKTKIEAENADNKRISDEIKNLFTEKLTNTEDAERLAGGINNPEAARERAADFDFKYKKLNGEILSLREEIKKSDYNAEKFAFIKAEYDNNTLSKAKLTEKLGFSKKNALILSQKYEERCIIEKSAKDCENKINSYVNLYNLVKAKQLMEFVAEEYLAEITAASSKTMLTLSGGKYNLIYDKDFYVLDNLNGGMRRSVSSLSGGETFLVSLSLALSLSGEIYSKSNRPMEFFFLDEGFGTLDDNLIETVLDSLEKLKNSHFSIGLISHVAEMKNRIQRKILVSGATELKGSTITIV